MYWFTLITSSLAKQCDKVINTVISSKNYIYLNPEIFKTIIYIETNLTFLTLSWKIYLDHHLFELNIDNVKGQWRYNQNDAVDWNLPVPRLSLS